MREKTICIISSDILASSRVRDLDPSKADQLPDEISCGGMGATVI